MQPAPSAWSAAQKTEQLRTGPPVDPDWEDDGEPEPGEPPDLTVYPTEDDPEPVLYLPDGTPLYRWKPPFGFSRQNKP